jgi:aryl-alcohol dehydrogenase-like predicted oxidoreductase
MEYRLLGRTGLRVSVVGFGCGAVGGLLVKGERQERVRAVARAVELGVNYFDTAAIYGDGLSETNLGAVLAELKPNILGTKVRLTAAGGADIAREISASVEGSLTRLCRDCVDLIQLHNPVAAQRQPDRRWVSVGDVEQAIQAFEKLREQGKARFWGINGLGETAALHQAIGTGQAHTIQCCYNLINPSAGRTPPAGFPFQDYARLIDRAAGHGMGVIAIRVLAGGALSAAAARHPNAAPAVEPIASGQNYAEDVMHARRFDFLVAEGYAGSLAEAALRFAIGKTEVSTALVGISNLGQLEQAAAYAERGPLSAEALARVNELRVGIR